MWTIRKKSPKRQIRGFLLGLLALIGIPSLVNIVFGDFSLFDSVAKFFKEISYGFTIGACFWFGNWAIGTSTGRKLNWRKNPARANMISLLSFIFFGMLVSIFVPYTFMKFIWHVPADRFINSLAGNAFLCISVDVIIISIYYSNYLVYYWGQSIKNEEELKRENLIARYEALKSQVNPHFLFNTLNTLAGVVEKSPEKASEFIHKLSDIYRYVLEQKDRELISLEEELKFVEDYIFLSRIRYGEGLQVANSLGKVKSKIVPLGLQILIENAIKHNVISDDQVLKVEMGIEGEAIFVRNNLQRKSQVEKTNQVGLENLVKRYEYLSDKPVSIRETDTVFEVKIPILQSPDA